MKWAEDLFPINRSITGDGVKQTFNYIRKNIGSNFKIRKVKSNKSFYDWKVPKEWSIKDAYIMNENGKKICDFKNNNLHIIGYSQKIKKTLMKEGDLIETSKNEAHATRALKNSEFLVFTQGPRGGKEYENDTFRFKKPLVK